MAAASTLQMINVLTHLSAVLLHIAAP